MTCPPRTHYLNQESDRHADKASAAARMVAIWRDWREKSDRKVVNQNRLSL